MFYSIEAEKSLLGAVLYTPELFEKLQGVLYTEDFYDPSTRKVFQAQSSLYNKGIDISVVSVVNELQLQKVEDVPNSYVRELLEFYRVDDEAALAFSTQISEFAGLRNAQEGLSRIAASITDKDVIDVTLGSVLTNIQKLTDNLSKKAYKSSELYGQELVDDFLMMLASSIGDSVTFTGIAAFDSMLTDVLNPGEITVLGARPGVGKTAMMLQIARMLIKKGKRVGFISLEMRPNKLMQRLVSAESQISMNDMLKAAGGVMALQGNSKFVDALEFYSHEGRFVVDRAEPGDIDTIIRSARKMTMVHGVDIVFIDYLQLIEGSAKRKSDNRQQEVADISRRLKKTAESLSIPIVTASQLSREATKSVAQRPSLAHLRESGAIEQDASVVIFLYPVFSDNMTEEQRELALKESSQFTVMIEIAKQRNGTVGRESVTFRKEYGVFVESHLLHDTNNEYAERLDY